ncbi:hypothetical protein [Actinomyces sp. MRS3W]|uniref:hypothetical protein n=1 Tax=Actinomyces sp. MRS3W TaxID=2800796 RepID=UPI0028FD49B9|nr:hypothetical protein [Actinomyces sp. MRS3W]MDU0348267.1 hypothetical protein [Actinomyces sp. MRS3W]
MTMWNQPGPAPTPGAQWPTTPAGHMPTPGPRRGFDADGLPSLKVPRIVLIMGVATLLVGIVLFVAAVRVAPSVRDENAVALDQDGTAAALGLLEDTEYGLYSSDGDISCTVTDPSGTKLDVYAPDRIAGGPPPQVLGFRSQAAGTYTVACTGDSAITINTAYVSPEWNRSLRLVSASMPFGFVGAIAATVGTIWFVVRRRARGRAVMGRLLASPQAGSTPYQQQPNSALQPGFVPGQPAGSGYGASSSSGPTATGPQPPASPQGSYGTAPQQVVYRPLPPPENTQGR